MKTPTIGRPRAPAITRIVAGTFIGTRPLVEAIVKESTHEPAWRPVRAGAAMALAARDLKPGKHVWMTTAEFQRWLGLHFRPGNLPTAAAIGMAASRRQAIQGGARIDKVEALAIAHHALGLDLPVEPGNVETFAAWTAGNFGPVFALNAALELGRGYIADRTRGFTVRAGERFERLPDAGLIRAMDWVRRVGPFSPYGERLEAEAFPGQTKEPFPCGS